jgi:hypothetical protein
MKIGAHIGFHGIYFIIEAYEAAVPRALSGKILLCRFRLTRKRTKRGVIQERNCLIMGNIRIRDR